MWLTPSPSWFIRLGIQSGEQFQYDYELLYQINFKLSTIISLTKYQNKIINKTSHQNNIIILKTYNIKNHHIKLSVTHNFQISRTTLTVTNSSAPAHAQERDRKRKKDPFTIAKSYRKLVSTSKIRNKSFHIHRKLSDIDLRFWLWRHCSGSRRRARITRMLSKKPHLV